MNAFCTSIVTAKWFERTILAVILLAGLLVGLETSADLVARHGHVLHLLDKVVLGIFVAEMALKMGARLPRPWDYFRDPWNVFDFVIVAGCLLPVGGSYVAILRLFRVLRVLRLVTALPKLQQLVTALLKSLPSLGYVGLLLGLVFYMYAVVGVMMFGKNDPANFGGLGRAMLTLFSVVTLEGWVDILNIQRLGSDQFPELQAQYAAMGAVPRAAPLVAIPYFVSFILIGTMVMLNLLIGVVINAMDEAHRETLERELERQGKSEGNELRLRIEELKQKLGEIESLIGK